MPLIKPRDPKKPPIDWKVFIAARIATATKMAAMDKNWQRYLKLIKPTLDKEMNAK